MHEKIDEETHQDGDKAAPKHDDPSVESAEKDFNGLVQLVKDRKVRTEGVILVEHDADGQVKVSQTGDHLGRKGLGWGGGVGLVVGLFSPALLG